MNPMNQFSKVRIYHADRNSRIDTHDIFEVYSLSTSSDSLILENDEIEAQFSPATGFLQQIKNKSLKSTMKVVTARSII